jgi:hypothetical protein
MKKVHSHKSYQRVPFIPISSLSASLTITPHIFLYGFVLTLISLATSSPYRAAAAKSLLACSSSSDLVKLYNRVSDSTALRYRYARCEYAVRRTFAACGDTAAVVGEDGRESLIACARSESTASMFDDDDSVVMEKMVLPFSKVASSFIRRSIARFTHALAYSGHCSTIAFNSAIPASISVILDVLDMRPTISLCWRSSAVSCEVEMLGWAGSDGSIDEDTSFCCPTEEGRVSGSKSAFSMRASFADRDVFGRVTAMVVWLWKERLRTLWY